MVGLNSGSDTTPCPTCGEPMGLVSWVGEKPECPKCAGATVVDGGIDVSTDSDSEYDEIEELLDRMDEFESDCLHEQLERSLPPNQRGGPHMLACPCPKCSTWC